MAPTERQPFSGDDISVCLLAFNHVNVIESTIQSVMAQSVRMHEVIVSDDCSTDGTWERILELAAVDSRIRPVRTPKNVGMAGNANFAVAQSQRPYVALLHHDDLCRPDMLEKWRAVMERQPDIGYVFNSYSLYQSSRLDDHSFSNERLDGKWFLNNFLFPRWGCPVRGTAMIRRSWWEKLGGMRIEFGLLADVDLWMRLSAATAVGYVAEPLITVRHARPDYYPEIYKGNLHFWERQHYLYEIHATNRMEVLRLDSVAGRLKWWWFRWRISCETSKWLAYAVVKRRVDMIVTSDRSTTLYDILPLRVFRVILRTAFRIYRSRGGERPPPIS